MAKTKLSIPISNSGLFQNSVEDALVHFNQFSSASPDKTGWKSQKLILKQLCYLWCMLLVPSKQQTSALNWAKLRSTSFIKDGRSRNDCFSSLRSLKLKLKLHNEWYGRRDEWPCCVSYSLLSNQVSVHQGIEVSIRQFIHIFSNCVMTTAL